MQGCFLPGRFLSLFFRCFTPTESSKLLFTSHSILSYLTSGISSTLIVIDGVGECCVNGCGKLDWKMVRDRELRRKGSTVCVWRFMYFLAQ